jgi:hypothetical protein
VEAFALQVAVLSVEMLLRFVAAESRDEVAPNLVPET